MDLKERPSYKNQLLHHAGWNLASLVLGSENITAKHSGCSDVITSAVVNLELLGTSISIYNLLHQYLLTIILFKLHCLSSSLTSHVDN